MAFDVSEYLLCSIEKWIARWQSEFDVSNIFKSLLYLARYVKWGIVHKDGPLYIKDMNDLGLNKF